LITLDVVLEAVSTLTDTVVVVDVAVAFSVPVAKVAVARALALPLPLDRRPERLFLGLLGVLLVVVAVVAPDEMMAFNAAAVIAWVNALTSSGLVNFCNVSQDGVETGSVIQAPSVGISAALG
jgi:hypothetical protein